MFVPLPYRMHLLFIIQKANKAIVKLVCGIRGGVAYHNYTGQIANSTVVEGDEQV